MFNCSKSKPSNGYEKALANIVGNDAEYDRVIAYTINNGEFSENFKTAYKEAYPDSKDISVFDDNIDNVVEFARKYSTRGMGDGRLTITQSTERNDFNYATADGYKRGFHFAVVTAKAFKFREESNGNKVTKSKIINFLLANFKNAIITRIADKNNINRKEASNLINNKVKTRDVSFFVAAREELGGDDMSTQDSNLLALLLDISTNEDYRNRLFMYEGLKDVVTDKHKNTTNEDISTEEFDVENGLFVDDDKAFNESDTNDVIARYDHSGIFSSHLKHFDSKINNYFDSLPKLKSNEQSGPNNEFRDFDRNNEFGLLDTMSAKACIMVLKSFDESAFNSVPDFIDAVKRIAASVPGFEAFYKFAYDMENDADFAIKMLNVFAKPIYAKTIDHITGESFYTEISNSRVNRLDTLIFDYINQGTSNITTSDYDYIKTQTSKLVSLTNKFENTVNQLYSDNLSEDDVKEYEKLKSNVVAELAKTIHSIFPFIEDNTIEGFINMNEVSNLSGFSKEAHNISVIASAFNKIVNKGKEVNTNFKVINDKIIKAEAYNRQLRSFASEAGETINESNLIDVSKYKSEEYVTQDFKTACSEFAQLFNYYSIVPVELTSSNAAGNNSSNIVNASYLSTLLNMIHSDLNSKEDETTPLNRFGSYMFQSRQFDLSPILLEHNENGKRINPGLFRLENGKYVQTEYATKLLNASLFDGTKNDDTETGVMYPGLLGNDYLVLQYDSYHTNKKGISSNNGDIQTSTFFLRTPSDAPKNYRIDMPIYNTKGLINVDIDGNKTINKNHVVFKILKNIFQQEIDDMAQAIDVMFVHNNGVVNIVNGDVEFSENLSKYDDKTSILYKTYHYVKNIFTNVSGDKFNRKKLTGRVFNSNMFSVTHNGVNTNFMDDVFVDVPSNNKGTISLLYGGATDTHLHIVNGKAVLTEAQNENVENALSNFILAYVEDSINKINASSEYFKVDVNDENIADYALNYFIANRCFDDLFEGTSKIYKDSQDELKRAKEVQGSGTPYKIVPADFPLGQDPVVITKDNCGYVPMLNTEKVQKLLSKAPRPILQRTGFTGITIKGVETNNKELKDRIKKELIKNGVSEENAEKKADRYLQIKANDAQSYITFEEWVRRISARGQLLEYMPIIEDIIEHINNPSHKISATTKDKFAQIQKNFYYDQYYDDVTRVMSGRQIKNAEIVLIPGLIDGTELQKMYELMTKYGIDQINTSETSKAGTQKVLTLFDSTGHITDDTLSNFENTLNNNELSYIQNFDYRNLYTQQETPQHVNTDNKLGVQIWKKILDNLFTKENLEYKRDLFELLDTNIDESYSWLMDELGVERDANGNLLFDDNGNPEGLNVQVFLDKMKEELLRYDVAENELDFVTIDEHLTRPLMPFYASYRSNKFEQVAQSIFNNITRQTLPGFHAVQTTRVGWSKYKQYADVANINIPDVELEYYPDGKPIIQVLVPKSMFNFAKNADGTYKYTDEELRKQLEDAHLDEIIGYRIPTEGKYSVGILKVVGFIDDAFGSTIVVPDGWVAQTGSDFDMDTIYGIQHSTYLTSDGVIKKTDFKTEFNKKDYINYLIHRVERKDITKFGKSLAKAKAEIDEIISQDFQKHIAEEGEAYQNLSDNAKQIIKDSFEDAKQIESFDNKTPQKKFIVQLALASNNLLTYVNDRTGVISIDEEIAIKKYITNNTNLINYLESQNEEIYNLKEEAYEKQIEDIAKKYNLPSFEEYQNLNNSVKNSRSARNTKICDNILSILKSSEVLEENLTGSMYDDAIAARDEILSGTSDFATDLANRSVYNPIDQAKYQSEGMSFAKLKGISVTLDNFCSVCNTARPNVANKFAFNIDYENGQHVEHDKYGWSEDNLNVEGNLITAYSAQTTAHILDAIKVGGVPNINDYTFGVYKNIVSMGSTYRIATGFIMQPALKRIVDNYNKTNSVFSDGGYSNPVMNVIKDYVNILISDDKKKFTEYSSDESVYNFIDSRGLTNEICKVLGISVEHIKDFITGDQRITLNEKDLIERAKGVEKSLSYDLAMCFAFIRFKQFSNKITAISLVSNPDKFGAKQSIYATQKIFDDISRLNTENCPLYVDDKTFFDAIYPGISSNIREFAESSNQESVYPSMYYFLKRASAASILINRTLFDVYSTKFKQVVSYFADYKPNGFDSLTEEEYNSISDFIISYMKNKTTAISSKVGWDKESNTITFSPVDDINPTEETTRIFGFGYSPNTNATIFETKDGKREASTKRVIIEDLNNPTQEEIDTFVALTPAQKVMFIKQNFINGLVCDYLKPSLYHSEKSPYKGQQTINFLGDNVSIDIVISAFLNTYYNDNPLLKLTAIDLIKYATLVEGGIIKKNGISSIVPNKLLNTLFEEGGLSFISEMDSSFTDFTSDIAEKVDDLVTYYVRSHPNSSFVKKVYYTKLSNVGTTDKLGVKYFPKGSNDTKLEHANIHYKSGVNRQGEPIYTANNFISIKYKNDSILYKIVDMDSGYYLYPLNKLNAKETSEYSANPDFNIRKTKAFYTTYIQQLESINLNPDAADVTPQILEDIKNNPSSEYSYQRIKLPNGEKQTLEFDINSDRFSNERNHIIEHFKNNTLEPCIINSNNLSKVLAAPTSNVENAHPIQYINGVPYTFTRINTKPLYKYTKLEVDENKKVIPNRKPIETKHEKFRKFIEEARDREGNVSNLIEVKPVSSSIKYSSAGEQTTNPVTTNPITTTSTTVQNLIESAKRVIISEANDNANPLALTAKKKLLSINSSNTANDNMAIHAVATARYVVDSVENILNGEYSLNHFMQDKDGEYLRFDDDKVFEELIKNPILRNQWIKTVSEARKLIFQFDIFGANEYDIDDPQISLCFNNIVKAIRRLKNNEILANAEVIFVNKYLDKVSNNPNVKMNLVSVAGGFHSTGIIESAINDLQDSGNPVVQVLLKEILSYVSGKELEGKHASDNYTKELEKIKATNSVDYSNIITEDGNLRQDYSDSLPETHKELLNKMQLAYAKDAFGLEHLKAKLEYDKFLVKHFNREITDDYYKSMIGLTEDMINHHSNIFVRYKKLTNQLHDLINDSKDGYNPDVRRQINNITRQINNLTSDVKISESGEISAKNPNDRTEAAALRKYREQLAKLNDATFETEEDKTFFETLKKQQSIVFKAEQSARTLGYVDENALLSDEKYIAAKQWIAEHAYYQYDIYDVDENSKEFKQAVALLNKHDFDVEALLKSVNPNVLVAAAQKILRSERGSELRKDSIYKRLLKEKKAYDVYRRPLAELLSDDDIKKIKEEQEARFNISSHHNATFVDKNILRTATNDDTVYNKAWYEGLAPSGMTNPEYLAAVSELNNVLRKAYNARTKVLDTTKLTKDELKQAISLLYKFGYDEETQEFKTKQGVSRRIGSKNNKKIADFIEKNAELTYDGVTVGGTDIGDFGAEFLSQYLAAKNNPDGSYFDEWHRLNMEWNDKLKRFIPNRLLWGSLKPKDEVKDKFINYAATNANKVNKVAYTQKPTTGYYDTFERMSKKSAKEFKAWYDANHIYNPYTHTLEPLACWLYYEPTEILTGKWKEQKKYATNKIKADKINKDYKAEQGLYKNYKQGSGFDNPIVLNDAEKAVKELIQKTLNDAYKTPHDKIKAIRGVLPKQAMPSYNLKQAGKDALELVGVPDVSNVDATWKEDKYMDYEHDVPTTMPLTADFYNSTFEKQLHELKAPDKAPNETNEKYAKKVEDYYKQKKQLLDDYKKFKRDLLSKDWDTVIPKFIELSYKYNAIQDMKNLFYFGRKILERSPYLKKSKDKYNVFRKEVTSTADMPEYVEVENDKLLEQYNNYGRRLIYDQWKKSPNSGINKAMKVLQGLTSSKYMAMNIRGGVANVTLGLTQILGERFAKDYFGHSDWYAGVAFWNASLIDFMANSHKDVSTTLGGALVKYFNVIDYDEIRGLSKVQGIKELHNKFRNLLFVPQTAGEHFMQNSVLFAMLKSHRVIEDHYSDGTTIKAMNQEDYIRERTYKDLESLLDDTQLKSFNEFKEEIKKDRSVLSKYATMRKDVLTEWIIKNLDKQQQRQFNAKVKQNRAKYIEDFKKAPSLDTQFKLNNGKLSFADKSILLEKSVKSENQNIADSYLLLGEFRERVISVNKKIHGVYDKLGSARIENTWWGSILMQYHKHLLPNILKRYRRQGTFNEIRGSVEKGFYTSLIDFLSVNARALKYDLSRDKGGEAVEGLQNMLLHSLDYILRLKLTYDTLPQYEKDNIRRNLGDLVGCMFAIAVAIGLKLGWDDDDSVGYNFWMYEMDRLATETMMYNIGGFAEAKTLWSSPVAVQQQLDDALSILTEIPQLLFDAAYSDVYKSGQYAGQKKWEVKLKRNIPVYRQVDAIYNLKRNNKYYKRGENMLGIFNIRKLGD